VKEIISLFLFMTSLSPLSAGEEFCGIRNTSFKTGEVITYNIYYSVIGLYANAGTASFTTSQEMYNGKPTYHVVGVGSSNSKYDWIFKVRDRYESYIDTASLKPYRFIRDISEGGYKKKEDVTFNRQTNTAKSAKGTFNVPACVQDVISSIYYARNINFDQYKAGDKIPFSMFLDDEVYNLYIRYLGKEQVKTKYGKFNAIKFRPLLVNGTIFEGGEKMNVWVSDDMNHIPLRIESPIVVGSIKVDMMSYSNLRHTLSSKVKDKR
jgi:hypothetical protein